MRGKIAFVLGAAVGYVLGTRAGRERYEQIKRGAQTLWKTEPVQQGVDVVQGAVGDGLHTLKSAAMQSGKDMLSSLMQQGQSSSGGSKASSETGTASQSSAAKSASSNARPKSTSSKSSASKSSASKGSGSGASKSASSKSAGSKGGASDS